MDDAWLSAHETAQLMLRAGILESDRSSWIAWACRSDRLTASGFGRVDLADTHAHNAERDFVSRRVWRVIERADPRYKWRERPERRDNITVFVDWVVGHFGYVLAGSDDKYTQEMWSQVHFDRLAVQSLLRQRELGGKVKNRAGRPATYDWPTFEDEAKRLIWYEGGFHEGYLKAHCERAMAEWCERTWTKEPKESAIREHVGIALTAFEAEKANN